MIQSDSVRTSMLYSKTFMKQKLSSACWTCWVFALLLLLLSEKQPQTAFGIELNHLLLLKQHQPIQSFFTRNINETTNRKRRRDDLRDEQQQSAPSPKQIYHRQTNETRLCSWGFQSLLMYRMPSQTSDFIAFVSNSYEIAVQKKPSTQQKPGAWQRHCTHTFHKNVTAGRKQQQQQAIKRHFGHKPPGQMLRPSQGQTRCLWQEVYQLWFSHVVCVKLLTHFIQKP